MDDLVQLSVTVILAVLFCVGLPLASFIAGRQSAKPKRGARGRFASKKTNPYLN